MCFLVLQTFRFKLHICTETLPSFFHYSVVHFLKAYQFKPAPALLRPLQWIYSIYGLLTFVGVLLLLFPFVIISSFFGVTKGGNMISSICRIWGYIWLPLVGIFHRNIYEAPIEKDKQYVFISNHISYMDIALIYQGVRTKSLRVLAKAEFGKVPIFGFLYRYATVMVDRGSAESRAKSIRRLKTVIQQKVSIFIYPEGTFNETEAPLKSFYDGAFRTAIETQTPLKPVMFLDTVQRLHYKSILSLSPGKSRSVILPEIPVAGLTLADVPALRKQAFDAMEACLIKYLA
jgi:1-acyl-sn-glycerol-3-phosphate acyltransferase